MQAAAPAPTDAPRSLRSRIARLLFWRRPADRMREFAETEAFGARDLARAAEQTADPWVRRQLVRHALDEVRHAQLLSEEAGCDAGGRPAVGLGAGIVGEVAGDSGVDLAQMGEIRFLAFVHVAERRAAEEFAQHRETLGPDEGGVFQSILADERRHVEWTRHALDRHRAQGRGAEVDAAIRAMRWQRLRDAWLWVARRISLVMSHLVLGLLYVGLAPFCLVGVALGRTSQKAALGWQSGALPRPEKQF